MARVARVEYHFWAFVPEGWQDRPLHKAIEEEGYELLRRVDGIDVYSDDIKLAWEIHGLFVWLSAALESLEDISQAAVNELVRTSRSVAFPGAYRRIGIRANAATQGEGGRAAEAGD